MTTDELLHIKKFFDNNPFFKNNFYQNTILINSVDLFDRLFIHNNRIINFHTYDDLYDFKPDNINLSSDLGYINNDVLYLSDSQTLIYNFNKQKTNINLDLFNIKRISSYAYEYTNILSIDFQNVNEIYPYAFENCATLLCIDCKNITLIDDGAFYNNINLISIININSNLSIHNNAFEKCNINIDILSNAIWFN